MPQVQLLKPNAAQTYIPISPSKRIRLGQKRVQFEEDSITPKSPTPLMIALRMAEKHENNPSTTPRNKYRKTIDLRSASGWTKWNLDLFNAKFEKDKYSDLRGFLGEDSYGMDSQFADGNAI